MKGLHDIPYFIKKAKRIKMMYDVSKLKNQKY